MLKVLVLADHSIGYRCVEYLIKEKLDWDITVFTTQTNEGGFWKPISNILGSERTLIYNSDDLFYKEIRKREIDYILLLSWKYVLSEIVLKCAKRAVINLHYSLLPKHRGVYPVNWAIISGDKITGVSFHIVDTQIDEGELLMQSEVEIDSWDTSFSLIKKLDKLAFNLFINLAKKISNNRLNPSPQIGEASYHSYRNYKKLVPINLKQEQSIQETINLFRGVTFIEGSTNLYFIDPITSKKIFIDITLRPEDENTI